MGNPWLWLDAAKRAAKIVLIGVFLLIAFSFVYTIMGTAILIIVVIWAGVALAIRYRSYKITGE